MTIDRLMIRDFGKDDGTMVPFRTRQAVGHIDEADCPETEACDTDTMAIHDFRADQTYKAERGQDFGHTATMDTVNLADYEARCVPGDRAPEDLRTDADVIATVRKLPRRRQAGHSLCPGSQILGAAIGRGRYEMSSIPTVRPGGEATGCSRGDDLVRDRNLATEGAWPQHPE